MEYQQLSLYKLKTIHLKYQRPSLEKAKVNIWNISSRVLLNEKHIFEISVTESIKITWKLFNVSTTEPYNRERIYLLEIYIWFEKAEAFKIN